MLGNPEEAMEATQWTFLRALETGFEVRSRGEALAWLYKTAAHRCLWVMRNQRTRSHLRVVHKHDLVGLPISTESRLLDRDLLERAIARSDDRTATIALLTFGQGMTADRAAEVAGVSPRTVARAKKAFEQTVRDLAEEDE